MKKEDFYNTKIHLKSKKESERVQNLMFDLGFGWTHHMNKSPKFTNVPFLYFGEDGVITFSDIGDSLYFDMHPSKLITLEDLGIVINWKKRLGGMK